MAAKSIGGWRAGREIVGADDANWDLCIGFMKWGMCDRPGCTWRHEPAVWWEGAWWHDDGTNWGAQPDSTAKVCKPAADALAQTTNGTVRRRWDNDKTKPEKSAAGLRRNDWWRRLPDGDECPVSLTPINELENEPFELSASPPGEATGDAPKHRFDAKALADFLVSSGHFINPVNRRPLEISECRALDKHFGKDSLRVADAFVLAGHGSASTVAQRDAASLAHHLFHFPSVRDIRDEAVVDPALPPNTSATSSAGRFEPAPRPAAPRPVVPRRDARTVHAAGGLQVVDDDDSASDAESQVLLDLVDAPAPTPAEAAAAAAAATAAAPARPKRAPRPPRAEQAANNTCSSSTSAAKQNGTAARPQKVVVEEVITSIHGETESATGSREQWVPHWASVDLQAAQLSEVSQLMCSGDVTVDQFSLAELRKAVERRKMLTDGPGLKCEARNDVAGNRGLLLTAAIPLFYPTMPLRAELRNCSAGGSSSSGSNSRAKPGEPIDLLLALENVLKKEVLKPLEGGRALEAAVLWLKNDAPREIERLRVECAERERERRAKREEEQRQLQERQQRQAAAPAAPAKATAAPARVAEKFSPNWDLCIGFVKTGKCKNKNCKWRHEMPVEKKKEAPPPPSAPDHAAAKKGKKKKG